MAHQHARNKPRSHGTSRKQEGGEEAEAALAHLADVSIKWRMCACS
jgi:hypothetical protein